MHKLTQEYLDKVAADVQKKNKNIVLYCTECCTSFILQYNGNWQSDHKVASVIQDRLIVCTCGTTLGVYASAVIMPGQVIAVK
jgi:hypothetical protein